MAIKEIMEFVGAISTIVIAIQLGVMICTEKKNREETRRLQTIRIMENWSSSLKKEASSAETIVEHFDRKQCRRLYKKKTIIVNRKTAKKIQEILPKHKIKGLDNPKKKKFKIKNALLLEFRWYVISYLNMLESVLTAWDLKIVDTEVIKNQFQYLYKPEKDWNVLEEFRQAAGGNKVYPNIDKFINELKNGKTKKVKKL